MEVGGVRVDAVSDGTFVVRRSYFGGDVDPGSQPGFFDRRDAAWLPIGCFVVRPRLDGDCPARRPLMTTAGFPSPCSAAVAPRPDSSAGG